MQWQEPEVTPATLAREKLVPSLDLARYAGRWHEIAKSKLAWIAWESECTTVSADYRIDSCGNLEVTNSCFRNGGLLIARKATGKVVYPEYPGALHLVFHDADAKPGRGWYFLLDTDYDSYAVVGSPERKFMWILSRTGTMCKGKFARLVRMLQDAGYPARDPEWGLLVNPGTVVDCRSACA